MNILLAEDEPSIRFAIRGFLEARGFTVRECETAAEAEKSFQESVPDAAVLDYLLPDGNALELLPRLNAIAPDVPIAVLTGHGSIDLAVQAVKAGAEQFLTKPLELPALELVLRRMIDHRRRQRREAAARRRTNRHEPDPFAGTSDAIRRLAEEAEKLVETDLPILMRGETGTGKGVLARWFHRHGARRDEPFVDINCAGLSRELLESELFGHEKGSFTSAEKEKPGLFEVADRGTVFLDEVGDVDLQVQPKLLKVLEDRKFRRVGGVRERSVDVRFLSATHRDIAEMVGEDRFRRDLYYRISTIPLQLPSLRERPEDIPVLARQLLESIVAETGRGPRDFTRNAEEALRRHSWPGNVRELRNVLERASLLSTGDALDAADLQLDASVRVPESRGAESLTLEELEKEHIRRVLDTEGGNVPRAAERLGIPRSSLYEKIKRLGLRDPNP